MSKELFRKMILEAYNFVEDSNHVDDDLNTIATNIKNVKNIINLNTTNIIDFRRAFSSYTMVNDSLHELLHRLITENKYAHIIDLSKSFDEMSMLYGGTAMTFSRFVNNYLDRENSDEVHELSLLMADNYLKGHEIFQQISQNFNEVIDSAEEVKDDNLESYKLKLDEKISEMKDGVSELKKIADLLYEQIVIFTNLMHELIDKLFKLGSCHFISTASK